MHLQPRCLAARYSFPRTESGFELLLDDSVRYRGIILPGASTHKHPSPSLKRMNFFCRPGIYKQIGWFYGVNFYQLRQLPPAAQAITIITIP